MDDNIAIKILPKLLIANNTIDISVKGHSMIPSLFEGDTITICKKDKYVIGDILVFAYKYDMLLTHRLVKIDDSFFCKGDNAFRLEDIKQRDVIGKVMKLNGEDVLPWPRWKATMSYEINRSFFKCRYNIQKTKETALYKVYEQLVLKKDGLNLKFVMNEQLHKISTEEIRKCLLKLDAEQRCILEILIDDIISILSKSHCIKELLYALALNISTPNPILQDAIEAFISLALMDDLVVLSR